MNKIYHIIFGLLSSLYLASAMELTPNRQDVSYVIDSQSQTDLWTLSPDIFNPLFEQLPHQSRGHLLSTCRKFHHYGLDVYYPKIYPGLDSINWQSLNFLTPKDKFRFTQLVIVAAEGFDRLSSMDPPYSSSNHDRLIKIARVDSNFDSISHYKNFTAQSWMKWPSLGALSKYIIEQTKEARKAYGIKHEKENPQKPGGFMGNLFAKTAIIKSYIRAEEHPFVPLFEWISEYASGKVIVKHGYGLREHPIVANNHFPAVTLSPLADASLKLYSAEIEKLLNQFDPASTPEYGLHGLIFGRWHAFSGYAKCLSVKQDQDPYCISDGSGFLLSKNYFEVPQIPQGQFEKFAHPLFVKLFKDRILERDIVAIYSGR